jgi:hypothetical protein
MLSESFLASQKQPPRADRAAEAENSSGFVPIGLPKSWADQTRLSKRAANACAVRNAEGGR